MLGSWKMKRECVEVEVVDLVGYKFIFLAMWASWRRENVGIEMVWLGDVCLSVLPNLVRMTSSRLQFLAEVDRGVGIGLVLRSLIEGWLFFLERGLWWWNEGAIIIFNVYDRQEIYLLFLRFIFFMNPSSLVDSTISDYWELTPLPL